MSTEHYQANLVYCGCGERWSPEHEAASRRSERRPDALAAYRRALIAVPGIEDGRDSYEPWQENVRRVLAQFDPVR